jgi:signal transduction histidine kinase
VAESEAHGRISLGDRWRYSVRFRSTAIVVVMVGASLAVGLFVIDQWLTTALRNDVTSRSGRVVESMADALVQGQVPAELFSSPAEFQQRIGAGTGVGPMGSLDDLEDVISSTYFYLDGPAFSQLKVRGVDAQGRLVLFGRDGPMLPSPDEAFEVTRTVPTRWGDLTIHAVSSVGDVDRSVAAFRNVLVLMFTVLTLAAGYLTWKMTGVALGPVANMTSRVRQITTTGNLEARVDVSPIGDEVTDLGQTLNAMIARVEAAAERQREFVSDASHELRSPISSIRAQLESALRSPDGVDWPDVAAVVLAEDLRLEHMVNNLLALAKIEEGRILPRAEVDLDEIVLSQRSRMTAMPLDLSAVSAGRVWGNEDELTSVVRNLMDNAARHAGSQVQVSLQQAGPWVVLRVDDDGPGIPVEDRSTVFERFARLQAGRARDAGGAGLGLALTKRIVEQHGGRISVEDSPLGGAAFVVALPSAAWTMGLDPEASTDVGEDLDPDSDDGGSGDGTPTDSGQGVPAATGT